MLSKFSDHKLVSLLCAAALAFVLGGLFWSYFALRGIQSPLILRFTDPSGVTQVGSLGPIMGAGILGLIMVAVNFTLALELDSRDTFLGKFTAALTLALSILLFVAVAAIISVN